MATVLVREMRQEIIIFVLLGQAKCNRIINLCIAYKQENHVTSAPLNRP